MKSGRRLSWKLGKQNAKILVAALNGLANRELDDANLRKEVQLEWWDDGNHLRVKKTTLHALSKLTGEWGEKIDTEKIRNAIKCLEELGFLEDKRSKNNSKTQTGSKEWRFLLKLVDTELQKNLDWLFGKENQLGEWDLNYEQFKKPSQLSHNGQQSYQEIIPDIEENFLRWKVKQEVFYSSPPATSLAGEMAIFYPLPLRIYVCIETDSKNHSLTLNESKLFNPSQNSSVPKNQSMEQYSHLSEYKEAIAHLFKNNIYPYLFQKTGLKITVLSSLPPAMGLNSGGAFALCFAQGLVDKYLDLEKYKQGFGRENADKQKVILELALEIESCFYDYTRNYSL
ncbi:hypothetical protein [Limnoraphis robusta]|uniref:Effector-associated domain-containing protein n=1 Tax=Limnoraphis robusta CCNP1315 TaxID=3110306 RepID=A0ABU5U6B8_9CYAN|nr:hypothetical protein [Limnoraphis robusta]MEA5522694.1 hypothetical protein [Limnoraphis robusta CCNP1315]MEA5547430.1 hypothetical protein [Limnoraphis robusta CCNP1324]